MPKLRDCCPTFESSEHWSYCRNYVPPLTEDERKRVREMLDKSFGPDPGPIPVKILKPRLARIEYESYPAYTVRVASELFWLAGEVVKKVGDGFWTVGDKLWTISDALLKSATPK